MIPYKKIVTAKLSEGAILNEAYTGFLEDYLVLHCLLRKYKPKRFLEVGTNMGTGTQIIKNALGEKSEVFSLDLPAEMAHISKQHPISEGKGNSTGKNCTLPFHQLYGDSRYFNYKKIYPIHGWYIDGEHNYDNVHHESKQAFISRAKIIVWHDADMPDVWQAIAHSYAIYKKNYKLYRVKDTRIAYAVKEK